MESCRCFTNGDRFFDIFKQNVQVECPDEKIPATLTDCWFLVACENHSQAPEHPGGQLALRLAIAGRLGLPEVTLSFFPTCGCQRSLARNHRVVHHFFGTEHRLGFGEVVRKFACVKFGIVSVQNLHRSAMRA